MFDNNIGDNGVQSIISAISKLKKLTALQLDWSENKMTEKGAKSLSTLREWKNLKSLELYFRSNQIG